MKKLISTAILTLIVISANAQNTVTTPSPRITETGKVKNKTITIQYGQPSVKGRSIWGNLVPYGKVWRTGANETTSIEFSEDVKLEGQQVSKGKYALFTIPGEDEWTIILNKTIKWGAFSYKQDEDVLRLNVPVKKAAGFHEKLTFSIHPKGNISLYWENLQVNFKVK